MPPRAPIIGRALGLIRGVLRPLTLGAAPTRILVACSGGADSTALLGLLRLLEGPDRLELCVGSVDHGLRPESAAEVEGVRALAQGWGLPFAHRRLDLASAPGLPARARAARHEALRAMAVAWGADAIALGHTATDQAETVLLHLSRGAALDGLAAMPPIDTSGSIDVVRPMLQLARAEARALCTALGLGFIDDPTNDDPRHPRIAIRCEILPRLAALRPAADLAIAGTAAIARDAEAALASWAERERIDRHSVGGAVRIDAAFVRLPIEIQRRIVRTVGLHAGVDSDALGRRLLGDVCRALGSPGPCRRFDIKGGFCCVVERDSLRVVRLQDA